MLSQSEKSQPPKLFSTPATETAQASQGILCPYFCGYAKIPVTWVTPAMNIQAVPVSTGGGGKSGSAVKTSQYRYYADLLGIVCMGPINYLYSVIVDGVYVWGNQFPYYVGGPGGSNIAIPPYGIIELDPGLETQGPANYLNWSVDDNNTPRGWDIGKVRIQANQLYFGAAGKTSVPTIELVVFRGPVVPGFDPYTQPLTYNYRGANPIGIVYEILTNFRYGCNLPASAFDMTFIANEINWLGFAYSGTAFVSPYIDTQQPVRTVIQDLLSYFDGYIRKKNGLIQIGSYRHSASLAPVATFNMDQATAKMRINTGGYSDTINEVLCTAENWQNAFGTYTGRVGNAASMYKLGGKVINVSLQKPYLVDPQVVQSYMTEYVHYRSVPQATGSIQVAKATAIGVFPGDLVSVQMGDYGAQLLARVQSKTWSEEAVDSCELEIIQELGTFESQYSAPPDTESQIVLIAPHDTKLQKVVALPGELRSGDEIEVGILCERLSPTDLGFLPWLSEVGILYDPTNEACPFCIRMLLNNGMGRSFAQNEWDRSGNVGVNLGIDSARLVSQTVEQSEADQFIGFVDNEIVSLGVVTNNRGGSQTFTCIRGIFGSQVAAHTAGTSIYWIERANLKPVSWPTFAFGQKWYAVLQVFTQFTVLPISDCTPFSFVVSFNPTSLYGPTNLVIGTDGKYVTFSWTPDPSRVVAGYQIRYGPVGGNWQQATVAVTGIESSANVYLTIPPGTWTFYVASYDSVGVFSAEIAQANFTVPYFYNLVEFSLGADQHGLDPGGFEQADWFKGAGATFVNCDVHPTAYCLVPIDQTTVQTNDNNVFDTFCPILPTGTAKYQSPSFDSLGSGTAIRSSCYCYEYLAGLEGIPPSGLAFLDNGPDWSESTITGGRVNPIINAVIPNSSHTASYLPSGGDGFELFDNFVYEPVATTTVEQDIDTGATYPTDLSLVASVQSSPDNQAVTVDTDISDSSDDSSWTILATGGPGSTSASMVNRYARFRTTMTNAGGVAILSGMQSQAVVGPPEYWTPINPQQSSSTDDITWGPWYNAGVQFYSSEFVRFLLEWNWGDAIVPSGPESFWFALDAPSQIQRGKNVPVPASGLYVTYPVPFRTDWTINVTPVGTTPVNVLIVSQSVAGFDVELFDPSTGVSVAGVVNWIAEGV